MKHIIALLALTTLAACASKSTSSTPAKQETPPAATSPEKPVDAKKVDKSAKKSKKAKGETAQTAATEKKAGTVGTAEVNCKSGSDERKLSIQVKGSGCELNYTKNGETKAIASQINGSEKCEEVMTNVKNKLVAAGHTCN